MPSAGDIYVEFLRQGNAVRATAIDAASGVEASVVGPANAHQNDLQKLAVAKLLRALGRAHPADESGEKKTPPCQGRGIIA